MLIFMGFLLFSLVFEVFVFVIILPIIQRITSKEIPSDDLTILSLILLIPSLWIYIQIVLLTRGEIEQIQYNISNLFPSNAIELSLQYNTPLLIFYIFLLLIVSIFLYSKVKYFRKNLITKLLFILIVSYNLYNVPFNIIDIHNKKDASLSNLPNPSPQRKKITTATLVKNLNSGRGWYYGLDITSDGKTLVSGNEGGIEILNLQTGEPKFTLTKHSVLSVAISPDSKTFVSGGQDKTINIWNLQTGKLKSTLVGHDSKVWSVAITPDGKTLISGSADDTIKIWDLQTGKLKFTLPAHLRIVRSLLISPDGKTLVTGGVDIIKIWNLQTGKLKATLTGHSNTIFSLAISLDGKTLVSGSCDGTIKIWNLQTGELKSTLSGHQNCTWSVAISPNGKTLFSIGDDSYIKIWNFQTGELESNLYTHPSAVFSLSISPDGNTLVSGDYGNISIWRLFSQ
ncbi:WD repeat protein (plasmid) [Sphaerospermopsis kisseleviana NIES-73]|nr:WD repeat protein [Sphaerospermopsis kisseleviana NIES-73]